MLGKRTSSTKAAPSGDSTKSHPRRRLRDALFIAVGAACLLVLLALVSHDPVDPGWSASGSGGDIRNLIGVTGAFLADIVFSLMGYGAYMVPFLLGYRAIRILINRDNHEPVDWTLFSLQAIGLLLVVIAVTSIAALNDLGSSGLPQGAGGIIGAGIGNGFNAAFNTVGARLILLIVLLLGLTVFADISWLGVIETLGGLVITSAKLSWSWVLKVRDLLARKRVRGQAQKEINEEREIAIEGYVEENEEEGKRILPRMEETLGSIELNKFVSEEKVPLFDADISLVDNLPSLELLDPLMDGDINGYSSEELGSLSRLLESKLADFGITARVETACLGPVVTRFEIELAAGIKVSRVSNIAKDLARSLAVVSVRVVEVIPGKTLVGIEIPNANRQTVNFKEVLGSQTFDESKSSLTLALGHDIGGAPVVADLGKMPHLLVAGTTGSGKSVGVNCMLLSLLYKSTPEDVRMILVDPKMLELSVYDGIPHLLTPVITDMKDAANGLRWCVAEMERRYKLMSLLGVRNLEGYNRKVFDATQAGEPILDPTWKADPLSMIAEGEQIHPSLGKLPSIVVVIDEFADMMMVVGKKVEELIARIAQKARAAGIHMILATQRPSVDVITGLIKANIPTRIAFAVSSKVDSRTILDQGGAEQLLGYGDMLYQPPGSSIPMRVHGAFCSDDEVHRVVAALKRRGEPQYVDGLLEKGERIPVTAGELQSAAIGSDDPEKDEFYDEAVHHVLQTRRASISSVQRKFRIGYNRAARLIETMELAGVVSTMGTNGQREVLAPPPADE